MIQHCALGFTSSSHPSKAFIRDFWVGKEIHDTCNLGRWLILLKPFWKIGLSKVSLPGLTNLLHMIPHCALGFTNSSHPGKIPFLVAAFPFDWSICHHVGHCQLRTVPSNMSNIVGFHVICRPMIIWPFLTFLGPRNTIIVLFQGKFIGIQLYLGM